METTTKVPLFCSGCRSTKPNNEFMGFEAKGALKQFRTCNNCHNRTAKQHMNAKKKQAEVEENEESQENDLEIIDLNSFSDYITEMFQLYLTQLENNINVPFSFQCNINISTLNKLEKEIVDELVEFIEDIDGFAWKYVFNSLFFKHYNFN